MNDIDAFIIIILLYTTIGHLYIDQYWGNRMKEAQEAIVYTLGASLFYIFAWLCWILGW